VFNRKPAESPAIAEHVVNRLVESVAWGIGALVLLAAAAAGGYVVHHPAAVKPVTVTTVGSVLHAPCSETSSGASSPLFLVLGNLHAAGLNGLYEGMCSVTVAPFNKAGNGVVTLTDSSGLRTTYTLGIPAGH
jgi:hypothetical protein